MMYSLNLINLVQASSVSVAILGAILLWRIVQFRGIALLLGLIATASFVNILEESGLTRNIYLISPVFVILIGPATYLAALMLAKYRWEKWHFLHLLPGLVAIGFTHYVEWVIAVGSAMRLVYAVLTGVVLIKFKHVLAQQRSDSDEFNYAWFVWLLVVMTILNFIDIVRLNSQHLIGNELNLIGQGINNLAWLLATMIIIVRLLEQGKIPQSSDPTEVPEPPNSRYREPMQHDYHPIFEQLDAAIKQHDWYRQPRLTLNDLSALSGLQSRDISRAINLVAQRSFNDYINALRVDFVCHAIEQKNDRSLTSIAMDAGFSSKASFNQTFKKLKGHTPSEYRRLTRG